MKKVLIVTYSYPPLNNIAARRFSELASHIINYGWRPYILTTNSSGDLISEIPENQIIRIGQHHKKKIKVEIAQSSNTILSKLLTLKRKLGFNSRLYDRTQHTWFRKIKKESLQKFKSEKYDLIIASFGPGSALSIGNYLSWKLDIPLIVDFRDLGALFSDKYETRNRITKLFDFLYEGRVMKRARAITTVSKAIKRELENKYNLPTEVIYNGWNKNYTAINKNHYNDVPVIYYAGSFYEHRYDSLNLILNALTKVDYKLIIRSLGPEKFNERIRKRVKELNIADKIELLPPANSIMVIKENQSADISLVVEDLDENIQWKKGNLTGKFLSLLTYEPNILAIARKDSEIGEILIETGKGKLCSTTEEIIEYLNEPKTKEILPKQSEIRKYSKMTQAKKLVELLNVITS